MLANIHSTVLSIGFLILCVAIFLFIMNVGLGINSYLENKGKSIKEFKQIGKNNGRNN